MDYKKICLDVVKATHEVGEYIITSKGKLSKEKIEVKGLNDFVTEVDKNSESKLVKLLEAILPEAGFIAEENTRSQSNKEYKWVIDPLDGTTNFIHSVPCFCISIALIDNNNEILVGVVHELNLKECFYAWKGGGAYLNGEPIKVSLNDKLKDSLLATGFPYYDYSKLDNYLDLFKFFMKNTHGIRRLGSAAADMAYVAAGRFEGFYEYGLKPWDVAAGSIIVKEAGGSVGDFKGGNNYLFGQEIVCSNYKIYIEFRDIIEKYMCK